MNTVYQVPGASRSYLRPDMDIDVTWKLEPDEAFGTERPLEIGSGFTLVDEDDSVWRGILLDAAPVHRPNSALTEFVLRIHVLDHTPIGYKPRE